jgi:hypothetical protein
MRLKLNPEEIAAVCSFFTWGAYLERRCCAGTNLSLNTLCGDASSSSATYQGHGVLNIRRSVCKAVFAGCLGSSQPDSSRPSLYQRDALLNQQQQQMRNFHKWYYISKQVDYRITACADLFSLYRLIEVAGPRYEPSQGRLLNKVISVIELS